MKDIKGYEGLYAVTEDGRVWSYRRKKFLKPYIHNSGYAMVGLPNKYCYVHRLVAEAYLPNPEGFTDVNHKDECRHNNNVENLEWCNRTYNINYGTANSRRGKAIREKHSKPVLCIELNKVFPSAIAVSRELRINVANAVLGKAKTAGGYHWQYVDKML